jgi:hypothetical protein
MILIVEIGLLMSFLLTFLLKNKIKMEVNYIDENYFIILSTFSRLIKKE